MSRRDIKTSSRMPISPKAQIALGPCVCSHFGGHTLTPSQNITECCRSSMESRFPSAVLDAQGTTTKGKLAHRRLNLWCGMRKAKSLGSNDLEICGPLSPVRSDQN